MMAQPSVPIRRLPGYLHRVRSDSLVRNSLYLMASTVVTAGLGYVFWVLAAHAFTSQEVGIGSAVISLCSTAALLTYLGSSAMLIERLPASEHSSEWTSHPGPRVLGHGRGNRRGDRRRRASAADLPRITACSSAPRRRYSSQWLAPRHGRWSTFSVRRSSRPAARAGCCRSRP